SGRRRNNAVNRYGRFCRGGCPAARPYLAIKPLGIVFLLVLAGVSVASTLLSDKTVHAQMGPEAGSELNGPNPMASPSPAHNEIPPPIPELHLPQPVRGSMMVSPPFGKAPLAVGFFVLTTDPAGLGFRRSGGRRV